MEVHSNPWSQLLGTGPPPIAEASAAGCKQRAALRVRTCRWKWEMSIVWRCTQAGLADAAAAPSPPPPPPCTSVPRMRARELSYERFCLEYMELNVPLLIEVSMA